jgi:hypothetical protein
MHRYTEIDAATGQRIMANALYASTAPTDGPDGEYLQISNNHAVDVAGDGAGVQRTPNPMYQSGDEVAPSRAITSSIPSGGEGAPTRSMSSSSIVLDFAEDVDPGIVTLPHRMTSTSSVSSFC